MKRPARWLLGIALLLPGAAFAEALPEPLQCLRSSVPPMLRVQEVELVVSERGQVVRTLRGKLYAQRETVDGRSRLRASLKLAEPPALAGAAYLVRDTDNYLRDGMYVYLPSVRRVRHVTGTVADGSMLGTNFSYYDFKQLQNAFGDLSASLEATGTLQGRPVYTVSFQGKPGTESRYSGVRAWIDQQTCVPLQVDFFEGNQTRKRFTGAAAGLRKVQDWWQLDEVQMLDLKDGSSTVLRTREVRIGGTAPPGTFDPQGFYQP